MESFRELTRMRDAMEIIRALHPTIPAQTITVFLTVAVTKGHTISMGDLGERLDMAQSSVSRNVQLLSKLNRHKEPGMDLVQWEIDPQDYRRRIVSLTKKGRVIAERMKELLK